MCLTSDAHLLEQDEHSGLDARLPCERLDDERFETTFGKQTRFSFQPVSLKRTQPGGRRVPLGSGNQSVLLRSSIKEASNSHVCLL